MFLFKKNHIKATLLFLGFCSATNATELRPLVQFDFPSQVTIDKKVNEVREEKNWHTSPIFIAGAEFIFTAEFNPFHYGFGIAFKSAQKHNSQRITPAAIPIWANLYYMAYNNEGVISIYVATRGGTLLPFTADGNWWERPFNFFIEGGAGIIMPFLPYDIGLEVNYNFSSMQRSFVDAHTKFRATSGRIGIKLSLGFELYHERSYKPNDKI